MKQASVFHRQAAKYSCNKEARLGVKSATYCVIMLAVVLSKETPAISRARQLKPKIIFKARRSSGGARPVARWPRRLPASPVPPWCACPYAAACARSGMKAHLCCFGNVPRNYRHGGAAGGGVVSSSARRRPMRGGWRFRQCHRRFISAGSIVALQLSSASASPISARLIKKIAEYLRAN